MNLPLSVSKPLSSFTFHAQKHPLVYALLGILATGLILGFIATPLSQNALAYVYRPVSSTLNNSYRYSGQLKNSSSYYNNYPSYSSTYRQKTWLEITQADSSSLTGYFCATRKSLLGGDDTLKLTLKAEGRTLIETYKTSYNSMAPHHTKCDEGDKNYFTYPLTLNPSDFCSSSAQSKSIKIQATADINNKKTQATRTISLPCPAPQNKPQPATTPIQQVTIINQNGGNISISQPNQTQTAPKYLQVSQCSDTTNNRIVRMKVSPAYTDPFVCESIRKAEYTSTIPLNTPYIQVALCDAWSKTVRIDRMHVFVNRMQPSQENICPQGHHMYETYNLDLTGQNAYILYSQCYAQSLTYDIVTRFSTSTVPIAQDICAGDPTRNAVAGEHVVLSVR